MIEIQLLTTHCLMGQPLRFLKSLSLEGVDADCLLLDAVRLFIMGMCDDAFPASTLLDAGLGSDKSPRRLTRAEPHEGEAAAESNTYSSRQVGA